MRSGWVAFGIIATTAGCGSGEDYPLAPSVPPPTISIAVPSSTGAFSTQASEVRVGGSIGGASFVHLRNADTGASSEGFVTYNQGLGTWFADMYGLQLGQNTIVATADADGRGTRTATAQIVVTRTP